MKLTSDSFDLQEREAAVQRLEAAAEFARAEANALFRSHKEEGSRLSEQLAALQEQRARGMQEMAEREAAVREQVRRQRVFLI